MNFEKKIEIVFKNIIYPFEFIFQKWRKYNINDGSKYNIGAVLFKLIIKDLHQDLYFCYFNSYQLLFKS